MAGGVGPHVWAVLGVLTRSKTLPVHPGYGGQVVGPVFLAVFLDTAKALVMELITCITPPAYYRMIQSC